MWNTGQKAPKPNFPNGNWRLVSGKSLNFCYILHAFLSLTKSKGERPNILRSTSFREFFFWTWKTLLFSKGLCSILSVKDFPLTKGPLFLQDKDRVKNNLVKKEKLMARRKICSKLNEVQEAGVKRQGFSKKTNRKITEKR